LENSEPARTLLPRRGGRTIVAAAQLSARFRPAVKRIDAGPWHLLPGLLIKTAWNEIASYFGDPLCKILHLDGGGGLCLTSPPAQFRDLPRTLVQVKEIAEWATLVG